MKLLLRESTLEKGKFCAYLDGLADHTLRVIAEGKTVDEARNKALLYLEKLETEIFLLHSLIRDDEHKSKGDTYDTLATVS